jgi:hypothetical protein
MGDTQDGLASSLQSANSSIRHATQHGSTANPVPTVEAPKKARLRFHFPTNYAPSFKDAASILPSDYPYRPSRLLLFLDIDIQGMLGEFTQIQPPQLRGIPATPKSQNDTYRLFYKHLWQTKLSDNATPIFNAKGFF